MRFKLLMILLSFLLSNPFLMADEITRSKKIVRSFKANSKTLVQVTNKYGNVHMIPWKKDSVRFEINLNITGNKESKVDRVENGIKFDFTDTRYYVIARTVFSNSMNNLWAEISDLTNTLFSSGNKAMINYTIYFPASAPVKIDNKFGNIYTTDHSGAVEIILSNGDLKAHDFNDELVLELQFGNASVNKVDHGRLELGYGEFEFNQVGVIDFEGKSAELTIEKAGYLKMNSRRDKIRIGQAGGLSGFTSFSEIDIELLTDEVLLSTRYGEFFLNGVGDAFRILDLDSEYTELNIKGYSAMGIDADLVFDDRTQTIFSEPIRNLEQEKVGQKDDQLRRSGRTKSNASRYAKIRIRLKGGSLSI